MQKHGGQIIEETLLQVQRSWGGWVGVMGKDRVPFYFYSSQLSWGLRGLFLSHRLQLMDLSPGKQITYQVYLNMGKSNVAPFTDFGVSPVPPNALNSCSFAGFPAEYGFSELPYLSEFASSTGKSSFNIFVKWGIFWDAMIIKCWECSDALDTKGKIKNF